jgi:hypothetical protein
MYDSFYAKCPKCKHELEFQSKTGTCCLGQYGVGCEDGIRSGKYLPAEVAPGLIGDVARCQFCNSRITLKFNIPIIKKVEVKNLGKKCKFTYDGNYNPKHPDSIKRMKELKKRFEHE